jgi:hypothetical protein
MSDIGVNGDWSPHQDLSYSQSIAEQLEQKFLSEEAIDSSGVSLFITAL